MGGYPDYVEGSVSKFFVQLPLNLTRKRQYANLSGQKTVIFAFFTRLFSSNRLRFAVFLKSFPVSQLKNPSSAVMLPLQPT